MSVCGSSHDPSYIKIRQLACMFLFVARCACNQWTNNRYWPQRAQCYHDARDLREIKNKENSLG